MWKLTNREGIMKDIDWNSAAALEFLGPPANNLPYQDHIQDIFVKAASVVYSSKNPFVHYIKVRCHSPKNECHSKCPPTDGTLSTQDGPFAAYAMQEDPNDSYPMINFCPDFFTMRRLRDAALDFGKSKNRPANYHILNYDNTAHVFLHELFHLYYFMDTNGVNNITDMTIQYDYYDPDKDTIATDEAEAYGPTNAKLLARFQELKDPIGRPAGSYVMRNADNMAWYALAKYVQDKIGIYPHLSIVTRKINGPPYQKPKYNLLTTFDNNTQPVFNTTIASNGSSAFVDDGIPDYNSCSDDLAPMTQTDNTTSGAQKIVVNISGMANDTVYPAAYIANLTSWLQSDFGVTPDSDTTSSSTSTPTSSSMSTSSLLVQTSQPPATTSLTSTPACVDNQVASSCITDILPSATPYSGPQGPSCAKADGASGSAARLNETLAQDAVSPYCQSLVDSKTVLSKSNADPKPGIEAGKAEGGADMVVTVMYDETSYPTDKSSSTLDFSTMGVDGCFEYLYTDVNQGCIEDSTWSNYNKDWTLEGGIYVTACALFSVGSQSG